MQHYIIYFIKDGQPDYYWTENCYDFGYPAIQEFLEKYEMDDVTIIGVERDEED